MDRTKEEKWMSEGTQAVLMVFSIVVQIVIAALMISVISEFLSFFFLPVDSSTDDERELTSPFSSSCLPSSRAFFPLSYLRPLA